MNTNSSVPEQRRALRAAGWGSTSPEVALLVGVPPVVAGAQAGEWTPLTKIIGRARRVKNRVKRRSLQRGGASSRLSANSTVRPLPVLRVLDHNGKVIG